ncbi:MAG: alpha/beta hydrolase, partial [Gillisia sp.]
QTAGFSEKEIEINKFTDGTLALPDSISKPPLVIFIQGSGPTDRNGNSRLAKNDGIKKIAQQLATRGIASYRFDKRIFKMDQFNLKEEDLRFEDFVTDVDSVLSYFKSRKEFGKIILAGHSEGSLIGILAAEEEGADALISLAGAGRPIDDIIVEQIAKQSPQLSENARTALDEIRKNGSTTNYNPLLESIFRASVQPFMASWMKYDPAAEMAKLKIPVLIINGTKDIQVDVEDARLLYEANPDSKLVLIDGMNHIFRKIEGNDLENVKTYNEATLPLHSELIPVLVDFIKSVE